jgi:hypothetical protein
MDLSCVSGENFRGTVLWTHKSQLLKSGKGYVYLLRLFNCDPAHGIMGHLGLQLFLIIERMRTKASA